MAKIDIRENEDLKITQIQFADPASKHRSGYYGIILEQCEGGDFVAIADEDADWCGKIKSKRDAENLIKALQKAIELNWWKE